MEIWFKTNLTQFRFPILPPELMINGSIIDTSVNILNIGEVSIFSGNNCQEGEISTFFPSHKYNFVEYADFPEPSKCISILRDWMNRGQAVQFIIPKTVNFPIKIVSFEYGERDGTGDVYFTLKWKEVVDIKIKKLSTNNSTNTENNPRPNDPSADKNEKDKQKIHVVVKGDCLYDIAEKYYGKGKDYPKIKKANENTYPSLKQDNYIYSGWKLVIP